MINLTVNEGFIHAYGPENGPLELVKRISAFEAELDKLLASLPESRRLAYLSRQKGAMELPGSERWIFPPVIRNEDEFRNAEY